MCVTPGRLSSNPSIPRWQLREIWRSGGGASEEQLRHRVERCPTGGIRFRLPEQCLRGKSFLRLQDSGVVDHQEDHSLDAVGGGPGLDLLSSYEATWRRGEKRYNGRSCARAKIIYSTAGTA